MTAGDRRVRSAPGETGDEAGDDWVDEQSKQSFPASDAPAWGGATSGRDRADSADEDGDAR